MLHSKNNNQYAGKLFEQLLCDSNIENPYPDKISKEEFAIVKKDAIDAKNYLPSGGRYSWIGDKYNDRGDIIQDGTVYWEIKYTNGSNGTWYNTSVYILDKYGIDYKSFLKPLYTLYEKNNIPYSKTNNSPVTVAISKTIRHTNFELAEQLRKTASNINIQVCSKLYNILSNNTELKNIFFNDMLLKRTKRNIADFLFVYDYKKHTAKNINIYDIIVNNSIRINGQSLIFGDKIRITLSWQNGAGLNNPTIRVFLID